MPTKSYYDLATDENFDIKIPAYPEEAFQQGIRFCAKYIGTQDISRPSSRVEIVAAMRHIRYEYKAKGVKKRNVVLSISVTGIEVYYQKRRRKVPVVDDNCILLMKHPTYRVFYVSHDSQDLKILSYIARDSGSNVFRCSVFKAYKNNDAILVVRTIGQAFEVCHKLNQHKDTESQRDDQSDKSTLPRDTHTLQLHEHEHDRMPNSESLLSATSSAVSERPRPRPNEHEHENGAIMRKSESVGSAPEPSGVSASSTATNGFMQNSVYSSGSVPNAFAALLSNSVAANGRMDTNGNGNGRLDSSTNVETAIKTAQELLNYASVAYRRPNNMNTNTPGSISVTTSIHESASMPRSPTYLPNEAMNGNVNVNGNGNGNGNGNAANFQVPMSNGGSFSAGTMSGSNVFTTPSITNNNQNQNQSNHTSANADRSQLQADGLLTNTGTSVLTAIAEAKQRLLEEQLVQETATRIDTQARVQQLLVINKQLTQHIYRLSERVQQLQVEITKLQSSGSDAQNAYAEHIQTTQGNNSTQSTNNGQPMIGNSSVDIPKLEPPPPSMHRQLRLATTRTISRDSSTASISDRTGTKLVNDVIQQPQATYNNLDMNLANSRLPHTTQSSTTEKTQNGANHLLLLCSNSVSDDENNNSRVINSQNGI